MQLTSPAFDEGDVIPRRYTQDGNNISPPLQWRDVPPKTQELALICEDPDAPRPKPFVHWLIYGIPGDTDQLPENVDQFETPATPPGTQQGVTSFSQNSIGYRGPAPPPGHGRHRYYFRLYALDRKLNLGPRVEKDALLHAMHKAQILATAELMGIYERPG